MNEKVNNSICRICLSDNQRCMSIFQEYKNFFIYNHINTIANVEIKVNDGLPDQICTSCLLDLETAINFKEKCESSNIILQTSILNSNNIDVKDLVIKKEEPHDGIEFLDADAHYFDTGLIKNNYNDYNNDNDSHENYEDIKPLKKLNLVELGLRESRAIDLHLQCDDCKGYFKSKCKLSVHWKKVHLQESLKCVRCKRTFKTFKAFNRHKQNIRKSCISAGNFRIEGEGKKRQFYCKECDYKSFRMKDMLSHWVIHTGDRPFKCDLCPKTCTQQSSLAAHKESAHKVYLQETTCHYCGKTLKGRNKIYRHLKIHNSQSVQCQVCKKDLKNEKYLRIHMMRHSGVKSFTCEICAKTFYTSAELSTHKKQVHCKGKYIYKCDKCDYKAYRNESIKKHKVKHTSTNVPCTVCGMFFDNLQKLHLHQRRHFEEKRYPCPHCELKFYRKDSVGKHVRAKHKCTMLINRPALKVKKEIPVALQEFDDMIEVELLHENSN